MADVLIERAGFLASLEGLLGEALDGSGRLVFLGGEAGIGKTTLAEALAAAARADDADGAAAGPRARSAVRRSGAAPATTSRPPRRWARSWTPSPS